MNTTKPIQIFKPGRHTAMSGAVLDFSESDLRACAAAYDPARHEAPLVVGHPRHDAPAYGWVKALSFADGALDAAPDQVDAAFAEMVSGGRFKKISASFYTPDSPQNPVPGVYYLRHVGFLGAQPPAVKGLRTPEFADAEEGVIEFADWSDLQNASLWRQMREWIISRFGLDEADKVIPGYAVATLEDEARQESPDETADPAPQYAEPISKVEPPREESHVTPEEKAALEAENAQLKQQLAQREAADRHTRNAAFAEDLVKQGKLLPARQAFIVAFMDQVEAESGVIEFGEGDAKQSQPVIEGFKAFLSALPKQVEFSEVSKAEGQAVAADFATAPGYDVDTSGLDIHSKALAYQESNQVDYVTAVKAVGGH